MRDVTSPKLFQHSIIFTRHAVKLTLTNLLKITDVTDDFIPSFRHSPAAAAAAHCVMQLHSVTARSRPLQIIILHQPTTDPVTCTLPAVDLVNLPVTACHPLTLNYLRPLCTLSYQLANYQQLQPLLPISFTTSRTLTLNRPPAVPHASVTFT